MGYNQEAIDNYNKAIELNPDFASAYYNRGISKRTLDDTTGALQDYQRAADLYEQRGDTERYQNALEQI